MCIALTIGTRPNYIKAFPVYRELKKRNISVKMIHTGQHYDSNMNDIFFKELDMDPPDVQFDMKNCSSEAEQISTIMKNLNEEFYNNKPKMIMVFGDVTSSLAAALVSNKLNIPLAHVESGLRSFDRDMPEEINRILIDNLANYLFITERSGEINLINDNIKGEKIFVGNTMIDTLVYVNSKNLLNGSIFNKDIFCKLKNKKYLVATIHRQSNVENKHKFETIVKSLNALSNKFIIVFPLHHRTKKCLDKLSGNIKLSDNIIQTNALGYIDFINLVKFSSLVLTDSGGIQEETTYMGIPCVTLRDNTERPITLECGTNVLSSIDNIHNNVIKKFDKIRNNTIELWDGMSSVRIVDYIEKQL